jgi:type VI secretion system protein ImpA
MQILMPAQVEQAKFLISKDQSFEIPIDRLQFAPIEDEGGPVDGGGETDGGDASASDGDATSATPTGEAAPTAADGQDVQQDSAAPEVQAEDAQSRPQSFPPQNEAGAPRLKADTRHEAFTLLEQIAAYYRAAEPSSPIAFIAERARGLADRDFLALLKDLLPPTPTN